MCRSADFLRAWFVRLRHPAHVLWRCFLRYPRPGQRSLEAHLWKLVDGFDHLRSQRSSGECGNGTESVCRRVLSGDESVQRPDVVPGVPFYLYPSNAPGGRIINPAAFSTPCRPRRKGISDAMRLRGFGATQWDLTLRRQFHFDRTAFSSGESGFFQHLQPPQFRQPDQLPQFSSIRAIDADAEQHRWQRRPEWRPQSAVSNRRTALDPTGSQTSGLNITLHDARSAGQSRAFLGASGQEGIPVGSNFKEVVLKVRHHGPNV